jgi:glyoxylase-like metal-dependent hydrolase (beta-lactamase superfamily II)
MNRRDFLLKSGAAVSLSLLARGPLSAQTPSTSSPSGPSATPPAQVRMPTPVTEFRPLRGNAGLFTGRGGTIGWLAAPDALVAVDTQFPDTAAIFLKDMPGRAGRKLDAVINTHHHGDHTGGNGIIRPATQTIVAQANVPELMLAAAKRSPNGPAPTLPDATFTDTWRRDFDAETIAARYFGPAHTRGDIAIHFEKANVVHTGDLVFNRIYPVIDRPGGASIRGWVTVLESLVKTYPADAIYLFGHGHQKFGVTGGHPDMLVFRDYLAALLAHVETGIKAGKSKDEIGQLENFPGFSDLHVPPGPGNRLKSNLNVAYDELTNA